MLSEWFPAGAPCESRDWKLWILNLYWWVLKCCVQYRTICYASHCWFQIEIHIKSVSSKPSPAYQDLNPTSFPFTASDICVFAPPAETTDTKNIHIIGYGTLTFQPQREHCSKTQNGDRWAAQTKAMRHPKVFPLKCTKCYGIQSTITLQDDSLH